MITATPMTVPSIWIGPVSLVNHPSVEVFRPSHAYIGAARPGDDNSVTNATKTCPLICFPILPCLPCLDPVIPYSHEGLYILCVHLNGVPCSKYDALRSVSPAQQ